MTKPSRFLPALGYVLFSSLIFVLFSKSGYSEENSLPAIHVAAQDSTKKVWAFSREHPGKLYTFDGNAWRDLIPPVAADGVRPLAMASMPGGEVACLWDLGRKKMAITKHRGEDSSIFATWDGTIPGYEDYISLFGDSRGGVWVTGTTRQITRIGPDGHVSVKYSISNKEMWAHSGQLEMSPIRMVEDGGGRVWAWSWDYGVTGGEIRGVLVFEGEKVTLKQIKGIKGIHESIFSDFLRDDSSGHLYAARSDGGIYQVDPESLEATPVPKPNSSRFYHLTKLFSMNNDLYVMTLMSLWRLKDGKWEELLDMDNMWLDQNPRWVQIDNGLILSGQTGAWMVREGVAPLRLDWKTGFNANPLRGIFKLADGSILGVGVNRSVYHNFSDKISEVPKVERIEEFRIFRIWSSDSDGNLWWIKDDSDRTLVQWDGKQFHEYIQHHQKRSSYANGLACDTRGRVWYLPDSNQKAGYFDSRTKQWEVYPNFETALLALKSDPPVFCNSRQPLAPAYNKDGSQIAFSPDAMEVHLYDGKTWRHWDRTEIFGTTNEAIGPVFFDQDDVLCIGVNAATWRLDQIKNIWKQDPLTPEQDERFERHYRETVRPLPPEGCPIQSPSSTAIDNYKIIWMTEHNQLYKVVPGQCVPVFDKDEPNPFATGLEIDSVYVDGSGNAFIKPRSDSLIYKIKPQSSQPSLSVEVEDTSDDSFRVRFITKQPCTFRWSLDDAEMTDESKNELNFSNQPQGTHTLRVIAYNEELLPSKPVIKQFEVHIDAEKQISRLIEELNDPDYGKRQAAITGLVRHSEQALDALKKARLEAPEDHVWWIDAAIQEIERKTLRDTAK